MICILLCPQPVPPRLPLIRYDQPSPERKPAIGIDDGLPTEFWGNPWLVKEGFGMWYKAELVDGKPGKYGEVS